MVTTEADIQKMNLDDWAKFLVEIPLTIYAKYLSLVIRRYEPQHSSKLIAHCVSPL